MHPPTCQLRRRLEPLLIIVWCRRVSAICHTFTEGRHSIELCRCRVPSRGSAVGQNRKRKPVLLDFCLPTESGPGVSDTNVWALPDPWPARMAISKGSVSSPEPTTKPFFRADPLAYLVRQLARALCSGKF